MITYKRFIELFEGKDIEAVQSFVDVLGLLGEKVNRKVYHRAKKVLKYLGLRNLKFKMISVEKRKLRGGKQ